MANLQGPEKTQSQKKISPSLIGQRGCMAKREAVEAQQEQAT